MIEQQNYGAHSAKVEMQLIINGLSLGITHMGRDFVRIETAAEYPPCEASIWLKVDEIESQWKVRLPEGISKDSNRVALALSKC
jgi:hypothetical protein